MEIRPLLGITFTFQFVDSTTAAINKYSFKLFL